MEHLLKVLGVVWLTGVPVVPHLSVTGCVELSGELLVVVPKPTTVVVCLPRYDPHFCLLTFKEAIKYNCATGHPDSIAAVTTSPGTVSLLF